MKRSAPRDALGERVEPAGVAGEGDGASVRAAEQAVGTRLGGVVRLRTPRARSRRGGAACPRAARGSASSKPSVAPFDRVAEGPGGVAHALLDAGRSRDVERTLAPVAVDRREQQRRDAAEVVAVEVGDHDRVDLARGRCRARASPVAVVVPQSSRTLLPAARTRYADWRRPPAPKASLVPTNTTSLTARRSRRARRRAPRRARTRARLRRRRRLRSPRKPAGTRSPSHTTARVNAHALGEARAGAEHHRGRARRVAQHARPGAGRGLLDVEIGERTRAPGSRPGTRRVCPRAPRDTRSRSATSARMSVRAPRQLAAPTSRRGG